MFCEKCGTELLENGTCPNCYKSEGASVNEQQSKKKNKMLKVGAIILVGVLILGMVIASMGSSEPIVGTWEVIYYTVDDGSPQFFYIDNPVVEVKTNGDILIKMTDEQIELEWKVSEIEPEDGMVFYNLYRKSDGMIGAIGVNEEKDTLHMATSNMIMTCERKQ